MWDVYHIILNPIAGHGRSVALLPRLTTMLAERCLAFETLPTDAPGDARFMAAQACRDGSEGIIGIGGDGTLQEIVSGMRDVFADDIKLPVPFGVLPCGSGNDFTLAFEGKREKRDSDKHVRALVASVTDKQTVPVDLIAVDADGQGTDAHQTCLNIANIGLDAHIVQNAAALKQRFKGNAYLAAAYKSIVRHKNVPMTVEIDGEVLEGSYALAAVCNGEYYGGGLRIAPRARINDGLITLCLVDALSRAKTMVLFPSILVEKHVNVKAVRFFNGRNIHITFPENEPLCVDGNLYGHASAVRFHMLPGALRIFAP